MEGLKKLSWKGLILIFLPNHEENKELKDIRAKIALIENEIGELSDMDIPLQEIEELLQSLRRLKLTKKVEEMEEYLTSLRERVRITV